MQNTDYDAMYKEVRGDLINALDDAKNRSNGDELLEARYVQENIRGLIKKYD